jgi:Holliday junction resolvase
MAMTPERKVKQAVVKRLKELGVYYFYPLTGGYGKSGVPDIVGCYQGLFFAIECKAGSNKPTPLQQKNLEEIRAYGGFSLVVNEDNIDEAITLLREHEDEAITHLREDESDW